MQGCEWRGSADRFAAVPIRLAERQWWRGTAPHAEAALPNAACQLHLLYASAGRVAVMQQHGCWRYCKRGVARKGCCVWFREAASHLHAPCGSGMLNWMAGYEGAL